MSAGDLLDLRPRLRRQKQESCEHIHVEIGMTTAELSCIDCGGELDPWWYLRDQVRRSEEEQAEEDAKRAAWQAWCDQANAKALRLAEEVNRLTDRVNRLRSEYHRLTNDPAILTARSERRRVRRAP